MNDDLRRLFGRLASLRAMVDTESDADRRHFLRQDIKQCQSLIIRGLNKAYPSEERDSGVAIVIRRVETSHSSAGWNQRDVMPE